MWPPLLVGLDNPHSTHPGSALLPRPKGSAGYRLWQMSEMPVGEYLTRFARINTCDMFPDNYWCVGDRYVIILGRQAAFRISMIAPVSKKFFEGSWSPSWRSTFIPVPHPSGRSRFYNYPENRAKLTKLLKEIS